LGGGGGGGGGGIGGEFWIIGPTSYAAENKGV